MKLNEIAPKHGSRKKRFRIGRGIGSGAGKTGGRGGKGQTARSGVRIKGFEGGQMPLHRRLPKRGFRNTKFQLRLNEVNLGKVQAAIDAKLIDASAAVDAAALVKAGLMRREHTQRETLIGLGLNKIGRSRDLPDTPMTRGMIAKVKHLVRIVDGK